MNVLSFENPLLICKVTEVSILAAHVAMMCRRSCQCQMIILWMQGLHWIQKSSSVWPHSRLQRILTFYFEIQIVCNWATKSHLTQIYTPNVYWLLTVMSYFTLTQRSFTNWVFSFLICMNLSGLDHDGRHNPQRKPTLLKNSSCVALN